MIRGAFWRAAASLLVVCGTGGSSLQSTCSQQSHSDDTIEALCIKKVCRGKITLLAGFWSMHIFSQLICAGSGVSFRLHLQIKAHFLFPSKGRMVIFLQSRNPAFLCMWSFDYASAALRLSSTKELVSWCQGIAETWRRKHFLISTRQLVLVPRVAVLVKKSLMWNENDVAVVPSATTFSRCWYDQEKQQNFLTEDWKLGYFWICQNWTILCGSLCC